MKLRPLILLFAKISLVFTFIVVIAGSVVRMTGSGMGCPDWPKCFGHLIPPTSDAELNLMEGASFDKGMMMIYHDTLWVANENLKVNGGFIHEQWHKYPKHDYATFNVLHTWVEYVNRLATVLYAFPIMILSVLCLLLLIREKDKITFFLALFTDIMIGYEIWLGKLVVDGNLKENSITLHMFGSIAIVSLLLLMIYRHRQEKNRIVSDNTFKSLMLAMLALTFLQIMFGTQVREQVDIVAKISSDRSVWIDQLPIMFKIHRSFSILVGIIAIVLFLKYKKLSQSIWQVDTMFLLILLEILVGVILSYFSMPATLQPIHLLLGVLLFASTFYGYLKVRT